MAPVHLANIDDDGNFIKPEILARLNERYGEAAGQTGITVHMTLAEVQAMGESATAPQEGA